MGFIMMGDREIGAALQRHWTASAAGNQDAEHEIYHDDAIVEYPQSGERIRGRHNVQALRSQHPARPSGFVVRRIVGGGDLWVTEYVITYDGRLFDTVTIRSSRQRRSCARRSTSQSRLSPRHGGPAGWEGSREAPYVILPITRLKVRIQSGLFTRFPQVRYECKLSAGD